MVGSRCPPVGVMAWPAGTTRGPSIQPKSMAFLSATSNSRPPVWMNRPEIAHGGEPGLEGAPGVGHRPKCAQRRIVLHGVERAAVVGPAEQEVDLHVHQPGQQGQVAQVDRRARPPGTEVGATSAMRSPSMSRLAGRHQLAA